MAVEYPELVAGMAKRQLTRTAVAKRLGITPRTLYAKLSGETDFTLSEANTLQAAFFPDIKMDILFTRAEQDSA